MDLSPNRSSRNGATVRLVCGHTAEGSRTKEDLGAFFRNPNTAASSHVGIDSRGILGYVPYTEKAWTLLNGNPISDNAELCGFARWSRAQWLSTDTIDGCVNPRKMLDNFAAWVRERCLARNIPIKKIDAAAILRGESGVIGHIDWTNTGDGSHTDPGPNFPWDYVINAANNGNTQVEDDDMSWDTQIPRTPGSLDKRTSAPASEMLRYANEAAWKAADGVTAIIALLQGQAAVAAKQNADLLAAVKAIPTTTGPDGSPVAKLSDVTTALENVFRRVALGFPVNNPGTGG